MDPNKNIFPNDKKVFSNLLSSNELLWQQAIAKKQALLDEINVLQLIANQKKVEAIGLTQGYCFIHPQICSTIYKAADQTYKDAVAIKDKNLPLIADLESKITILETAINNDNKAIFGGQTAINTAAQNTAGSIVQTAATLAAAKAEADKVKAESVAQIKKIAIISVSSILILVVIGFVIRAIRKKKVNE